MYQKIKSHPSTLKVYADKNATIGYDSDNDKTEFNVTDINLTKLDIEEKDTLAILANEDRLKETYLGGWLVDSVVDDDTLNLQQVYSDSTTDNITFVIGNEKRYDNCEDTVKLVDINSTDGTYEVDTNGIAYVSVKYDPYLVGKTVTFYANAVENKRVGTAIKTILFGTGISYAGEVSCAADENKDTNCSVVLSGFNSENFDLKHTLLQNNFAVYDKDGSCSIVEESNRTDCAGNYNVVIQVEKNTTCSVRWTGAVDYEY
jgi:hypothetical protein